MNLNNRIFDNNIHGHSESGWSFQAFNEVVSKSQQENVGAGNLIYFPQSQELSLEDLTDLTRKEGRFEVVRVVDPIGEDVNLAIEEAVKTKCVALKLHPRKYCFNLFHPSVLSICEKARLLRMPIMICSFPDGTWNRYKLIESQFLDLADEFPTLKFVWMHSGGHKVLDFMFGSRRRNNVFLDLSFSVNYFRESDVWSQFRYAINSMQGNYWIFGSDYPSFNQRDAIRVISDMELGSEISGKIFWTNAKMVYPNHQGLR